jgi:hypothetical protein
MRIYNVDCVSASYLAALLNLHNASVRRATCGEDFKCEWTHAISRALLAADDLRKASGIKALEQPLFQEFLGSHLGVCELLADQAIVERERQRVSQ